MPEEREGMSREEAGKKGGEAGKGSERHFTPESKERLKEGARRGGGSHGGGRSKERNISEESRERMREGGRKGGEH